MPNAITRRVKRRSERKSPVRLLTARAIVQLLEISKRLKSHQIKQIFNNAAICRGAKIRATLKTQLMLLAAQAARAGNFLWAPCDSGVLRIQRWQRQAI